MGFAYACPCIHIHGKCTTMQPPTKDQADLNVDNPTVDASDNTDEGGTNKDMARQEFAQEADINYMLSRFGITPPRGAPVYGEWDDTIDLQIALESVREAKAGFRNLPKDLQDKFGTMEEFLRAVDNGSLVIKDESAPSEPAPTAPAP